MSTEKQPKTYALDIFNVLDKINRNKFDFYSTLTEEEQKAFQPVVAMKWMFGTNNAKQVLRLNSRVNQYVFHLSKHKQLIYMLMCACTDGKPQRYTYVKTNSAKTASSSVSIGVLQEFYGYSSKRAEEALVLHVKEDILDMAQYLGRQTEDITKIKNEFKARNKG